MWVYTLTYTCIGAMPYLRTVHEIPPSPKLLIIQYVKTYVLFIQLYLLKKKIYTD